ncbi:Aste57867_18942 [Aphanomyces stellatus]|uniref:Aste57867_18942 protein n=1 Tax=Aphanomyces stellatus TaxID=120398 RepID=A0A485LD28_9STRA|nr:hypothetical protein As57867_018878 [Aphanomyces stellatus]VFT95672.1 Aste57867_18942 [Aphanomyces stellatus]
MQWKAVVAMVATAAATQAVHAAANASSCSVRQMPIVLGELQIGRRPLPVVDVTFTTDCRGVLFNTTDSRNRSTEAENPTCIWFPNGTVVRGAQVCDADRTGDRGVGEFHVIRTSRIQVDTLQFLPASANTIYLNGLGLRTLPAALTQDNQGRDVIANRIHFEDNAITSIDGIRWPGAATILEFGNNSIAALGDVSSAPNAKILYVCPDMYTCLTATRALAWNQLQQIDAATTFPAGLTDLYVDFNRITSLDTARFPLGLETLVVDGNLLTSLDRVPWPDGLKYLTASFNQLTSIDSIVYPPELKEFEVAYNHITQIHANFPVTLEKLCLAGNNITAFYANASQFELLQRLTNNSKNMTFVLGVDDNGDGAWDGTGVCNVFLTTRTTNATCRGHLRTLLLWDTFPICIVADGAATTAGDASRGSSTTTWFVLIGVAALVAVAAAVFVALQCYRQRHDKCLAAPAAAAFEWHDHPSPPHPLRDVALADDIRADPSMAEWFIPPTCVDRERVLATGGNGIIYLARVKCLKDPTTSRLAAMKRLLPRHAADADAIAQFMTEVRVHASLAHPNVVAFLGFTWTRSVQTLSILTEYMIHGDLWSVLEKRVGDPARELQWRVDPDADLDFDAIGLKASPPQPTRTSPAPSSASSSGRGHLSKFSVLVDVAEALAYLHGFNPVAVVHRDLKAKNVLLSNTWGAKLCDFGSSRAFDTVDTTSTDAIGTLPWTAPEVLKGVAYNEKADVYSFGVLMSEVDLCIVPYSNVQSCFPKDDDSVTLGMARARAWRCSS